MSRRKPDSIPPLKCQTEKGRPDRAYVWLDGKRHYLGRFGSVASEQAYLKLIASWAANDRRLPSSPEIVIRMNVDELIAKFWKHCQSYYVKHGKPTDEQACIRAALKHLNAMFGKLAISDFTAPMLVRIQERMVASGSSRKYVNDSIGRIKRCFKWGVKHGLVDGATAFALQTVDGLQRGRTTARESKGVKPVDSRILEKTLAHSSEVLRTMIRFQLLTACRPGEVCSLIPAEIDRSHTDYWLYQPSVHKNEHRGKTRTILINEQAQRLILPRMLEPFIFKSPRGKQFNADMYRHHVHEVCKQAGLPKWSPNQLRHNAGTSLRAEFGLEVASVILGHTKVETTQIYAEASKQKAIDAIRKFSG